MRMDVCDSGSFAVRWRLQKRLVGVERCPPSRRSLRHTMQLVPPRGSKLQLKSCGPHGRLCVWGLNALNASFSKKIPSKSPRGTPKGPN